MSDAPEHHAKPESDAIHPISRALGFLEKPGFPGYLTVALGVVAVALALVDLVHHRHELFTWEGWVGFHGWYGFLAFSFVVLMGWPLRALLSRPESYYGEDDGDA